MLAARNSQAQIKLSKDAATFPRKSNPEVARWLQTLSDVKGVLGDAPYRAQDMPSLLSICSTSNELTMQYAMAGIDQLKPLAKDQAELVKAIRRMQTANFYNFQDEIAGLSAFNAYYMARQAEPLQTFLVSLKPAELTPIRRAGAEQTRFGVFAALSGDISMANDAQLRAENRLTILNAVADNIDGAKGT